MLPGEFCSSLARRGNEVCSCLFLFLFVFVFFGGGGWGGEGNSNYGSTVRQIVKIPNEFMSV